MEIINTIFPIFVVISLGFFAKKKGLMPETLINPANRLTYYLAIPAMIFPALARNDLFSQFDYRLVLGTILPLIITCILFFIFSNIFRVRKDQRGTFIESAFHGNIGYIGFAIVIYYLGEAALSVASLLGAFLMLTHNTLAVIALQLNTPREGANRSLKQGAIAIAGNPIILTSLAASLFSISPLTLPFIIERTLRIIGSLALPMALLIIGASLSFSIRKKQLILLTIILLAKLLLLPTIGYLLYKQFNLSTVTFQPGLILLSAPVATVVYILAKQLNGDPDLATNAISLSTLLSLLTMSFWLNVIR